MHIKKIYRNEKASTRRLARNFPNEFLRDLRHFTMGLGQVYYKDTEDEIFDGGSNVIGFVDYEDDVENNRKDAKKAKIALERELSDWAGWFAEVDDDGDYAYLTITVE